MTSIIEKKLARVEEIKRRNEDATSWAQLTEPDQEWVAEFMFFADDLGMVSITKRVALRIFAFQSWVDNLGNWPGGR
jgi:hypothetical protein